MQMISLSRPLALAALLGAALAVRAQNTVFNDSFSSDALNASTYPAVTATSTGWNLASSKTNNPVPTNTSGLQFNMVATSSGLIEAQALFTRTPVQLLPGTSIEFTATFVPNFILQSGNDSLIVGLFNSGGTVPLSNLLQGGLTSAVGGGVQSWLGYNAGFGVGAANGKMLTRPAQGPVSGAQDLVFDGGVTGGYANSGSVAASTSGVTLTTGNTYTIDYVLSLSADNSTLTSVLSLYNGTGTSGVGANTRVTTYSGTITGTKLLTRTFDAMSIGWRSVASHATSLNFSSLTVRTTGGAPWFVTQPPTSLLASIGSNLNIAANVGGVVNTYQWQRSTDGGATFANIDPSANSSAASSTLVLSNVQNSDQAIYRLVATNPAGTSTSTNVTVTVTANPVAPSIVVAPVGSTVTGGGAYAFGVTVNGTSPLNYQWSFSADGVSYAPISGATNPQYFLSAVSLANEGYYEVTVSNVAGSVTSAPAQLVVNQPVTITTQPTGATLNVNDSYTMTAAAVGKPAPTYQWSLNGTPIAGATNASYTIGAASAAAAGQYTMTASNGTTSATTAPAAVAVLSPTLAVSSRTPTSGGTGLAPDTRLSLTFNQAIAIGQTGQIRIYDTANPTTPVDTIDIVAGRALMQSLRAASTLSTQALPVQVKTIGGLSSFNYYPITLSGSTATIYPRNNVLTYGHTYFVQVDPGVFTDASGLSFVGITNNSGWTFATKPNGPVSGTARLVVAADGTGDFNTIQGAIDSLPAGNTTPRTILIRKGTYFEQVYFNAKHALVFLGEDRAQSVITYPNNNTFNSLGTTHRGVFCADKSNNISVVNLTVYNSTPQGGTQAESLVLNGTASTQGIVTDVDLVSFQDTLLLNGQGYVANSHITGDVDFMWGNGPNFFENCELTAMRSAAFYTQIRNGSTGHGNVYLNCTLDAPAGIAGMFLGRIDPNLGQFPFSEVVFLNCVMGTASHSTPVSPAGWLLNNTPDQTAASAPNVHFWEYNSHFADGAPLDVSGRIGASKQLTLANDAATIANYSSPAYVLGGWTPQLAPVIASQPIAQSVDPGSGFTLAVKAFGVPAVSYQWSRNGTPIAGATNATYTVSSSDVNDAGTYAVTVSNSAGSVSSSTAALLVHGAAPVLLRSPVDTSALLGTTATLNVWAAGDGPFAYQWSKDGTAIVGATNQSLRLIGLQATDAGAYSVAVSNAGGQTIAPAAALTLVTPATSLPPQPAIPAATFDVTQFGAVGDGTTDNTAAFQAAINAAAAAGGGTVETPPAGAAYLTGPLTLPSNIDFQVDGGAVVQALPFGTYPNSRTSPSHFITVASGATNVELSGGGVIDGNGAAWWAQFDAGAISARPRLVQFTKETNVLVSGLTFQNSPNFHLAFSGANNNVTVYGVTISSPGDSPNTDGMDLAGTNFLVQGCSVSDGDDNIVAKPGSVFCSNLYIANCAFGTGHGVSVGGQTNVGMDGMTVTNCTFNGTDTGLRLKADATQGGPVQNLTFSNLTMTNVTYPIVFYSYYNQIGSPGARSGSSQTTPAKVLTNNATPPNSLAAATIPSWRNIAVSNLTATGASGYSILWGLPLANALIANVTFNNVSIAGGAGFEIYDATNVQFTGTNSVGPFVTTNSLAIVQQPQSATVSVGDTVTFTAATVGASGVGATTPTYQWNLNGAPLTNGPQPDGSVVSGATTAALTIANARVTEAGNITFTASNQLDGYDVTASALAPGSLPVSATSAAAVLTVNPLPATIALTNLSFVYDGTAKTPTAVTTPAGLPVTFTYNGAPSAMNAGTYVVVATIADPNYTGSAQASLVIAPAPVDIVLSNTTQTYDGTAKPVTVNTTPAAVAVTVLYGGVSDVPINAGAYSVAVTSADPNYTGSVTGSLTVGKATPEIAWTQPAAIVYGTPLGAAQLNATANVAGSFAYTPDFGTVLSAGIHSLAAVFAPSDAANYNGASAATSIVVTQASAGISLTDLVQAYDGTPKSVSASTTPSGLNVVVLYNGSATAPIYPGEYTVSAMIQDPNFSGTVTQTLRVTVTALVRHAPVLNGGLDGSVQMLSGENIALNGNAWISADLLVPGTPTLRINGKPTFAGTQDGVGAVAPSNYSITLNGGAVLRHVVRRIDPIAMPAVAAPPVPTGTRNVTLNSPSDTPGDFATVRNLTLNGTAGQVAVPPGTYGQLTANGSSGFILGQAGATEPSIYNLQGLTLNGSSHIQVVGPIVIVLANGTALNGSVGDAAHAEWVTLAVANGGLTLNGHVSFNGSVVAPNGTVTINGGAVLTGEVMSDGLIVNGNGHLAEPAP